MADKMISHEKEWEKLSLEYEKLAKVKNNSDMFFYRHQCIEGLIDGITRDYKKAD